MWSKLPPKLKILLGSMIVANIGSRVYTPFMPLYILSLGGSVAQVGLYYTVETISSALLRPFGGWISDSIGRLQTVGIGTLFGFLGMLGLALAPDYRWLLVAAVVLALGRSMVGPSFRAYTAEVAPPGNMAQTFGVVNGIFSTVDVIGPLLGGWVAVTFNLGNVFWVAVGFMGLATLLRVVVALRQPYRWQRLQVRGLRSGVGGLFAALLAGGLLTWLLVTDSLRDIGVSLYHSLESLLLQKNGLNEAQIGMVFAGFALVYLLVSTFASRIADQMSPARVLAASGVLHAFALLLLVVSPQGWMLVAYFGLAAAAFGLGDPAFDAMLARSAPAGHMGITFGLFNTAISFFAMPAPYLGALLWERSAPVAPFALGAVFLLAGSILTWLVLRPRLEQAAVPAPAD